MVKRIRGLLRKGITVVPTLVCMGMILSFESQTSDTHVLSDFDKRPPNQYASRIDESRSTSTNTNYETTSSAPSQHSTAEVGASLNCERLKALLEEAKLNPEQKFRCVISNKL